MGLECPPKSENAVQAVLQHARNEVTRTNATVPPFAENQPFSPAAYDAISKAILSHTIVLVGRIQDLCPALPTTSNLAFLLYRELHTHCCNHYFLEYERVCGFRDSRPEITTPVRKRSGFTISPITWATSKVKGRLLRALQSVIRPGAQKIYFHGRTTFDWDDLTKDGFTIGHRLQRLPMGPPIEIKKIDAQKTLLAVWAEQIHNEIADMLGVTVDTVGSFSERHYGRYVDALLSRPAPDLDGCSLLVTGTLGEGARLAAMRAAEANIPSMTIYHGTHFYIFDEPYWPLYETSLADYICGYGNIEQQKAMGILRDAPSLSGGQVQYLSRTDMHLKTVRIDGRRDEKIAAVGDLKNKTIVYVGVEFENTRYGPFRDVHPATYLAWQETLLEWLTKQSGRKPLVRPHPKRRSRRYDPDGYEMLEHSMTDALVAADVFVIDYPTTSLAYLAATDKPVLFANIGLRRLHPVASDVIAKRCHSSPINILAPEQGLEKLSEDFSRDCIDEFTDLFSWAPGGGDETVAVAENIDYILSSGTT